MGSIVTYGSLVMLGGSALVPEPRPGKSCSFKLAQALLPVRFLNSRGDEKPAQRSSCATYLAPWKRPAEFTAYFSPAMSMEARVVVSQSSFIVQLVPAGSNEIVKFSSGAESFETSHIHAAEIILLSRIGDPEFADFLADNQGPLLAAVGRYEYRVPARGHILAAHDDVHVRGRRMSRRPLPRAKLLQTGPALRKSVARACEGWSNSP